MTQQEFSRPMLRRNDRCACGSGKKFKHCHGSAPNNINRRKPGYIDGGESPVRWVITDRIGTSFFSTKDNEIIVFKSRDDARQVVMMDEFADQEPGDINIGGVGPTKWQHLQEKLSFIEVDTVAAAIELVRQRIAAAQQQLPMPETSESVDPELS